MWISFVLLLLLNLFFVYFCPYSKVEESFNLQAIHDILFLGHRINEYDHQQFPGVVPRTFIGPLFVAGAVYPPVSVMSFFGLSKFHVQLMVRFILGMMNICSFITFANSVRCRFGEYVMRKLIWITASQFHLFFYASRTLPNSMALFLVLLSLSSWVSRRKREFITVAGFSILVFRSELLLFYGPLLLFGLIQGIIRVQLWLFLTIVYSAIGSVALSLSIDSFFWRRWLWPEGEVFYYNAILNKSKQWGTSPFHWYFTSALPRALLTTSFLLITWIWFAVSSVGRTGKNMQHRAFNLASTDLIWSALLFVLLYSWLPHKELRFILYVIPVFNLAAAIAWQHLETSSLSCGSASPKGNSEASVTRIFRWLRRIMVQMCYMHLFVNFCCTILLFLVAEKNYPGGKALTQLNHWPSASDRSDVQVHICNLAAQTGVSRFLEEHSNWKYNKTEHIETDIRLLENSGFDYLVSEINATTMARKSNIFKELFTTYGFDKLKLNPTWRLWEFIEIHTKPLLTVYERIKDR